MANTEKQAVENFNRETGEIYWELDSEVRLRYIPICKTVTDDFDTLNEIIHEIDIFSILDWGGPYTISCNKRGLRVAYALREDELFPEVYSKGITINDKKLEYYSERFGAIKSSSDSDNYQNIYAALKTNKPIVAAVYKNKYFDLSARAYGNTEEPEVKVIINASNLDEADRISEKLAEAEAKQRNDEIYHKYWAVLFLNSALLSFFALGLFLIRHWVWRTSKSAYGIGSAVTAKAKSMIHGLLCTIKPERSTIIKTDNLKPYSVADELLKWTQLKDAGVVSEAEFQEARDKIMRK